MSAPPTDNTSVSRFWLETDSGYFEAGDLFFNPSELSLSFRVRAVNIAGVWAKLQEVIAAAENAVSLTWDSQTKLVAGVKRVRRRYHLTTLELEVTFIPGERPYPIIIPAIGSGQIPTGATGGENSGYIEPEPPPPPPPDLALTSFTLTDSAGELASTVTPSLPSGTQEGDLLVAMIAIRAGGGTTVTPPSGWTLVRRTDHTTQPRTTNHIYKKSCRRKRAR